MQGEDADINIIKGINYFNSKNNVEVIVISSCALIEEEFQQKKSLEIFDLEGLSKELFSGHKSYTSIV